MTVLGRRWSERDEREIDTYEARLPEYLCKYTGISGRRMAWFLDIVLRSRLFMPAYKRLNDPFDGAVSFDFAATEDEVRAYWTEFLEAEEQPLDLAMQAQIDDWVANRDDPVFQAKLAAGVLKMTEESAVACFGTDPDNLLLWSYYADSHEGVCLRFRTERFIVPGDAGCFPPMPVTYTEDLPKPSFYRASILERARSLLATKAALWAHEDEWRVINRRGEGAIQIDAAALDAVILGCRMKPEDKARVRDVVERRELQIPVLEAHRDAESFKILVQE